MLPLAKVDGIAKRKQLKMKLSSALYMLNLRKKRKFQVVLSTESWKYRARHRGKVRATK